MFTVQVTPCVVCGHAPHPVPYSNGKSDTLLAIWAGYMWTNRALTSCRGDRGALPQPARPQHHTSTAGPDRHGYPPLPRQAPLKTSRYHCIMAPGLAAATEPHHTATASTAGIAVYYTDRKSREEQCCVGALQQPAHPFVPLFRNVANLDSRAPLSLVPLVTPRSTSSLHVHSSLPPTWTSRRVHSATVVTSRQETPHPCAWATCWGAPSASNAPQCPNAASPHSLPLRVTRTAPSQ